MENQHTHVHSDGTVHVHSHEAEHLHSHDGMPSHSHEAEEHSHGGAHPHVHSHTQTKAVINRLSRAIGHLESVRKMVEDGRDCSEVLIQLAAVRSALNSTGRTILKDHMQHCIVDAIANNDQDTIDELNRAIDQFMK